MSPGPRFTNGLSEEEVEVGLGGEEAIFGQAEEAAIAPASCQFVEAIDDGGGRRR